MSAVQYEIEIKQEPLCEYEETGEAKRNISGHCVKQEPGCQVDQLQLKGETDDLYVNHEIKDEVVIGPVVLQQVTTQAPGHDHDEPTEDIPKKKQRKQPTFTCDLCNKQFFYNSYKSHCLIHAGVKPYSCNECDKQYTTKGELTKHKNLHKNGLYKCNICNKQYKNKQTLTLHTRLHTGDKLQSCSICDKQYTNKYELYKHSLKHKCAQPYVCKICGKRYTTKQNLIVHTYRHTGERPYNCNVCDKQYVTKYDLNNHMTIHKKGLYTCDICNKQYMTRSSLITHIRKHMSHEMYSCNVCDEQLITKESFNSQCTEMN